MASTCVYSLSAPHILLNLKTYINRLIFLQVIQEGQQKILVFNLRSPSFLIRNQCFSSRTEDKNILSCLTLSSGVDIIYREEAKIFLKNKRKIWFQELTFVLRSKMIWDSIVMTNCLLRPHRKPSGVDIIDREEAEEFGNQANIAHKLTEKSLHSSRHQRKQM